MRYFFRLYINIAGFVKLDAAYNFYFAIRLLKIGIGKEINYFGIGVLVGNNYFLSVC